MSDFLNVLVGASPIISFLVGILSVCITGREVHKIKIKKEKAKDKIREDVRYTITDTRIQEKYIEKLMEEQALEEKLLRLDEERKEIDLKLEKLEKMLKELEELEKNGFKA